MKKLFAIVLICSLAPASGLFAQNNFGIEQAPGEILEPRDIMELYDQVRELEIWSEDFADGIPADWTQEGDPSGAVWEYRGPSTDPSTSIGTRGSCIAEGSSGGNPIASPTQDNGFIIFDSNYWDDNVGPCGNFGAGPAPGPHFSSIITPEIDLTDFPNVGLIFTQYHKNYQATTSVQASVAGGEWVDIWVNDVPANNGTSALDDEERANVSSFIGGQSNVRLRFLFDGNYYFWMVDDILLFELEENNLFVDHSSYGDFDFDAPDHPTGFEYMEYSQYPESMPPLLKFSSDVYNYGANVQTNCSLHTKVIDATTMTVWSEGGSEPDVMDPEEKINFRTDPYALGGVQGTYNVAFQMFQAEEETSPENNVDTLQFEITDVIYSRDRLETKGIYVPSSVFNGTPYEVGNFFLITAADQACHSVSVGIGLGSNVGSTVYGAIYTVDLENGLAATEVANTGEFGITWESINTVGDNNYMNIPFPEPVALDQGTAYLLVVGTPDGPENVIFPISGDSPELTSMVRFLPNNWFYLVRTPMVRMNLGPVVSVEELKAPSAQMEVFPNPATENFALNITLEEATKARVIIYNTNGAAVRNIPLGQLNKGSQQIDINNHGLESGYYLVTLDLGGERINKTVAIFK
jgi:hypothetical protein